MGSHLISRRSRLAYGAFALAEHLFGEERVDEKWASARTRLFARLTRESLLSAPATPRDIERRSELSLEEFRRDYQRPGFPVVFAGAARNWPCLSEWTYERIDRRCGGDLLPLDYAFSKLRPVLREIRQGREFYLRFYALLQRHPEFLDDLDMPWLVSRRNSGPSWDQGFQTFIGNSRSKPTALHNANDANLFVQVSGRKEWCFYSPEHSFAINPGPIKSEYRTQRAGAPHFDPFNPDYAQFPHMRAVPSFRAVLEPGDVLWNPPYWWHAVRNLSDWTVGAGYRWVTPTHCLRTAPLWAACTARHPPVWESLRLADKDFGLVFLEQYPELKGHPLYSDYVAQLEGTYEGYREKMNGAHASAQR